MSDNENIIPNENVKAMVDSLAGGDNVAAQDAFKTALSDKIGDALDSKRVNVANDWLNAANEAEAIQNAAGLEDAGVVNEPVVSAEPVEIDSEEEDEQPTVSEV
tara:strand:- start:382 stop:693 length:312 start_codon:yes stop_codon:yes gene_type:complete